MRIKITFLLVMLVSLMQAQTTMVAFKAPESTPENAWLAARAGKAVGMRVMDCRIMGMN